ncbi:DUF4288 domain-containing protein [Stenotrophomonas sp. PS02289]|uniref:DUF4288 domain-containing protein n=1 Tax=Stenotrophomonas sp. PS02289 TaxID=2991422 RepID=UPI00249B3D27|nr:DUF4288 domain-containing protein [Stenotrophomonas sp. PS02289]
MWYCAHAIFYFQYEGQSSYRLHENVYLIQADTADAAWQRAETLAREREDPSEGGHVNLDGHKVRYCFAGIRKLIEAQVDTGEENSPLEPGVELTYSVMVVDSLSAVEQLAKGEETSVLYEE